MNDIKSARLVSFRFSEQCCFYNKENCRNVLALINEKFEVHYCICFLKSVGIERLNVHLITLKQI